MQQKDFFQRMEQEFQIVQPIFLNSSSYWNDNKLVHATDISTNSIGRYRLDFSMNKNSIQELWFDLEAKHSSSIISQYQVNKSFLNLKNVIESLLYVLSQYFPKDKIYIKASGSGFHVSVFVKGIQSVAHFKSVMLFLIQDAGLPNTKSIAHFGVDIPATISSRHKIRCLSGSNYDKVKKAAVDYVNYASFISVDDFLSLKSYPFCSNKNNVRFPSCYSIVALPDILIKLKDNSDTAQLSDCIKQSFHAVPDRTNLLCPAYYSILKNPDAEWYSRNYLVKWLRFVLKMDEKAIIDYLEQHCEWSDFNRNTTEYFVHKHFQSGTPEAQIRKPVRKKTLHKLGYCKGGCDGCCYRKH